VNIETKKTSFQYYEFGVNGLQNLLDQLCAKENVCDLGNHRPGFFDILHDGKGEEENIVTGFKEILLRETEVLEAGEVKILKHHAVAEGFLVIFRDLIVTFGKPAAVKSAIMQIFRFSKIEPRPLFISPEKLLKISDRMAFIKTLALDRIEHPTVKNLRIDGRIETLSDISPYHNYVSNMTSIKGILNTPFGIRTIKIACSGNVKISIKKCEEIDTRLFLWAYALIKGIK